MIDTHAHLYFDTYDADREIVVVRTHESINAVINIGIDIASSQQAINLAQTSDWMYASIGLHPEDVLPLNDWSSSMHQLEQWLSDPELHRIVAIGEIGLDYHTPNPLTSEEKETQRRAFIDQIELAEEFARPIIIHSRDAFDDTLAVLRDRPLPLRGVWHSFTEGAGQMEKALALGLYVGINGIVTYKSALSLADAVNGLPLDRLLLETDSPFLTPHPRRGERNEPGMVKLVAEKVAELKGITVEEVVTSADRNAQHLFGIRT